MDAAGGTGAAGWSPARRTTSPWSSGAPSTSASVCWWRTPRPSRCRRDLESHQKVMVDLLRGEEDVALAAVTAAWELQRAAG